MLYKDYTTKLLDMEHMNIRKIEVTESEILLHVDMKRRLVPCPVCGNMTDSVHDYRIQKVKDSPVQGKALVWYYRKRRYVCHSCGKRFLERNWLLPKWHRLTNRLALQAIGKLSDKTSRKDLAREFHVSESTICRWMNLTEYGKPDRLPPVLSIDEFRGNSGGEKFQCILTSPVQKRILDILPDCRESRIYEYLQQFPNRNEVRYFVSDMRKDYISMAKNLFPNAKIVIDKYSRRSVRCESHVFQHREHRIRFLQFAMYCRSHSPDRHACLGMTVSLKRSDTLYTGFCRQHSR